MTRPHRIFSDRVLTGSDEIEVRSALISIRETQIESLEFIPRDEVDWRQGDVDDLGQGS